MRNGKIRIGMIGAGFMGKAHSEIYAGMPDVELVAIASGSGERAKVLADTFGYKHATDDWKMIISDDSLDMVDIVTPNYLHKEVAIAAAQAGRNFVIEKPLARNVIEAQEIIEAVGNRVKAMYAENVRYAPVFNKVTGIRDQGGIGDIFMIRATEAHNGPFHAKWFWDADQTGGGVVIDVGIHGIYLVEWLMGSPIKRVYAETGLVKWHEHCKNGAEDTAEVLLRFENGGFGELFYSWAIAGGMDMRTEVYGSKGNAFIDETRQAGGLLLFSDCGYGAGVDDEAKERPHVAPTKGWTFPAVDEWNVLGHRQQLRHFVDCIIKDEAPLTTLEDGLRGLEVVEAIYKSASTGKAVEL